MTYVGITIQILEYYPQNFKYENFSFVFSSESRDFEKEITFTNKNSISHKILLPRKNLKYSVKITRNNSLIGICDFIIPFQVFTKREGFFNKNCQLTMTDSIRRLIFGNISPNNIKININANLQYLEKGEKLAKSNAPNEVVKKEEKEKRASTPKKFENKYNKNKYGNLTTILKLSKDEKIGMNKKITENIKKRSNSKPNLNNISGNSGLNQKVKNYKKGPKEQKKEKEKGKEREKEREKEKEKEKEKIKDNINNTNINKKEEKIINKIEKPEETSDIDEDLKNEKIQNNNDILNFMKSFINQHPLEKLGEFKEPYDLMIYTKNIINELLNYQLNFYSILTNSVNTNKKFRDLLLSYNDKYRLTLK